MADGEEKGPSEGHVRLLQGLFSLASLLLMTPCGFLCLSGFWGREIAAVTGVPLPWVERFLVLAPVMPFVAVSALGYALARSDYSRVLFLVTGLLGIAVFAILVLVFR